MVRFLQISLHHAKAASAALLALLAEKGADIVLIQEPWPNKRKIGGLGIRGFKLLCCGGKGDHGVCILARRDLKIFLLAEYSNEDVVAVSLEVGNAQYWLASVYMAKAAKVRDKPLIVSSDSNAHYLIWGSADINDRCKSLMEFILSSDIAICNRGNGPTFVTDITLISGELILKIRDGKVLDRKVNGSQYEKTFNRLIPKTPETNVETTAAIEETVERSNGLAATRST